MVRRGSTVRVRQRACKAAACGARVSAERAVVGDVFQGVLEDSELALVEFGQEQFRDPTQVDGSGFGKSRQAGVGQRDDDTACVRFGAGSPNKALLDQPGYTAG